MEKYGSGIVERLSTERAEEIIEMLYNDIPLEEGGFKSKAFFAHMVCISHEVLGREMPSNYNELISRKQELSKTQNKRDNKAMSEGRAKEIVYDLISTDNTPKFREGDDLATMRLMARKAIATVAGINEAETGDDHGYLIKEGENYIGEKLCIYEEDNQ
jgi:hypothetical protein